jgi:protein SCO1/2
MAVKNLRRRAALIGGGVLAFLGLALAIGHWQRSREPRPVATPAITRPDLSRLGGPFALVDQAGRPVTQETLRGRPSLIVFGFTHCPDVCPTTLAAITRWLERLGPAADGLQPFFITIDPERDTPELLALYLGSFDPRIRALTGSPEAIDAMASAWQVTVRRVDLGQGAFTYDHTTAIFVLDADARVVTLIDPHESDEMALAKIARVLPR